MRLDELNWRSHSVWDEWEVAQPTPALHVFRNKSGRAWGSRYRPDSYQFSLYSVPCAPPAGRNNLIEEIIVHDPLSAQCVLLELLEKVKGRRENHQPDALNPPPTSGEPSRYPRSRRSDALSQPAIVTPKGKT